MGRFSLPDEAPKGLTSPVTALVMKYMARAQVRIFRLTGDQGLIAAADTATHRELVELVADRG